MSRKKAAKALPLYSSRTKFAIFFRHFNPTGQLLVLGFYLSCLAGVYFIFQTNAVSNKFGSLRALRAGSFPSSSPSNKKINFNVPNSVDASSNHMNNQKEYWVMQNKLAMAKNSINVPSQIASNFTKSKEYIQANMRDSLRKSAYASLKYGSNPPGASMTGAGASAGGGYMPIGQSSGQFNSVRPGMVSSNNNVNTGTQYILPILFFDMGTNNLYKMFRQSAVIAYELKRTLIIPYFHTQPTVRDLIDDDERSGTLGQEEADHRILKDPNQGKPFVRGWEIRIFGHNSVWPNLLCSHPAVPIPPTRFRPNLPSPPHRQNHRNPRRRSPQFPPHQRKPINAHSRTRKIQRSLP